MTRQSPALFLDRDGVLNVDRGYVSRVEDFEWIEGAKTCIANFNRRGWYVFVVTNQSGIARGYYTEADMQALQNAQGVEAGKLFLTQMIAHHQGAITMAQNEVDNGQFPDAIALAKSMVSSQQKEIDTMNEILKSL